MTARMRGMKRLPCGSAASALLLASVGVAIATGDAFGFSFDDVDSEDAQAIETFLETATTDSENRLPSGRGTMMVVETRTDPAICRDFVVNLSDSGQKAASGCRTGSGTWALTDDDNTLNGAPLMAPRPASRPDVATDAPVPARLAGVPTIDIPQIALAPLAPIGELDDGPAAVDTAPASGDATSDQEQVAPVGFAGLVPLQRPDSVGTDGNGAESNRTASESSPIPDRVAGFPTPASRPAAPERTATFAAEAAATGADDDDNANDTAIESQRAPDRPTFTEANTEPAEPRPVPDRLSGFPQPQPKPPS